jgi:hypothetical protein
MSDLQPFGREGDSMLVVSACYENFERHNFRILYQLKVLRIGDAGKS